MTISTPGRFNSIELNSNSLPFFLEYIGDNCFLSIKFHLKITVKLTNNSELGEWFKQKLARFMQDELHPDEFPSKKVYKDFQKKKLILLKTLHILQEKKKKELNLF